MMATAPGSHVALEMYNGALGSTKMARMRLAENSSKDKSDCNVNMCCKNSGL